MEGRVEKGLCERAWNNNKEAKEGVDKLMKGRKKEEERKKR